MDTKAREDLELIRRMMTETRLEVVGGGKHFVIWGTITAVGLTANYVEAAGRVSVDSRWTWVVLLVVGWAVSMLVGWREGRGERVTTLARRILVVMSVAMGLSLTLVALAGVFGMLVSARALPGLTSVMLAALVLPTAVLAREWWLGAVAVGWWVGGGVMLFVPGLYTLLLMAAMSLVLLAVPGAVLHARSRRGTAGGSVLEVG